MLYIYYIYIYVYSVCMYTSSLQNPLCFGLPEKKHVFFKITRFFFSARHLVVGNCGYTTGNYG